MDKVTLTFDKWNATVVLMGSTPISIGIEFRVKVTDRQEATFNSQIVYNKNGFVVLESVIYLTFAVIGEKASDWPDFYTIAGVCPQYCVVWLIMTCVMARKLLFELATRRMTCIPIQCKVVRLGKQTRESVVENGKGNPVEK